LALGRAVVDKTLLRHSTIQLHPQRARLVLYLAYSAGERPGTVLRRFAEAYANGALVPFIPKLGEPKNQRRLIRPADRALFSFMLEIETSKRAYGRAHADGLSLSAIKRRFVVDYVLRERAGRASEAAPVQPKAKWMKEDRAALKE
jgi:hypothetical protein